MGRSRPGPAAHSGRARVAGSRDVRPTQEDPWLSGPRIPFSGVLLVVFGGLFLADQLGALSFGHVFHTWWPALLVLAGLLNLIEQPAALFAPDHHAHGRRRAAALEPRLHEVRQRLAVVAAGPDRDGVEHPVLSAPRAAYPPPDAGYQSTRTAASVARRRGRECGTSALCAS